MQLHSSLVIIQLFGNSFKFEKKLHLDFIKKIFSQSAHSFSEKTEREREREDGDGHCRERRRPRRKWKQNEEEVNEKRKQKRETEEPLLYLSALFSFFFRKHFVSSLSFRRRRERRRREREEKREVSGMSGAPPLKPWERARGGATPSSMEVTQVAQQAAATQQAATPETNNVVTNVPSAARGEDQMDASTSGFTGSAFTGTGYGTGAYGAGRYGGGYGGKFVKRNIPPPLGFETSLFSFKPHLGGPARTS